ncbi:MAG: protein imuA, partial [Phenylobacterium sp.]|nr:protein imuA [Phenylobacterium sp.]
ERLIQVCARDDAEALGVMEDALASTGVAVVLGEVGAVDLTAGRRLQLACEKAAATGLVIRRNPFGAGSGGKAHGSAAVARWRVAAAPSAPEANLYGEVVGLGAPRWRVELEYCRGGRPGAWLFERRPFEEDIDGTHPLRLVAELGDRQLAPPQPVRAAG